MGQVRVMAYLYVCEACRQALGLPVNQPYLNRVRRSRGDFSTSETPSTKERPKVFQRDSTGKPVIIGYYREAYFEGTNSLCVCHCSASGHDPHQCTGEADFRIGGRPGSGSVDAKAEQFGMEPTPEMVASMHEEVASTVRVMLSWLKGDTDEARARIEASLERVRYEDQIKDLRDTLEQKLSKDLVEAVYTNIKPDLKKLAKFRDQKVSHSWPSKGDWMTRIKREKGHWVTYKITADEVAEYIDLAVKLLSQLSFIPIYINQQDVDQL